MSRLLWPRVRAEQKQRTEMPEHASRGTSRGLENLEQVPSCSPTPHFGNIFRSQDCAGSACQPNLFRLSRQAVQPGLYVLEHQFVALRRRGEPPNQLRGLDKESWILLPDRFQNVRKLGKQKEAFCVAIHKQLR